MLANLTVQQIEQKMDLLDQLIARCSDPKDLPNLNRTYQRLLDELAERFAEQPSRRTES